MKASDLYSNIQTDSSFNDEVKSGRATYAGIAIKTLISLAIVIAISVTVGITLPKIINNEGAMTTFIIILCVGAVMAFIAAIVGRMSERAAKYCCVIYSIGEGISLGTITCIVEQIVPGAGWISVGATLAVFGTMLALYATGIIRVGSIFRRVIIGMTVAFLLCAITTVIVSFTVTNITTYLYIMIPIQIFFVIYGVITLALNFEEASQVVQAGCSKNAEWSVALGMEISFVYIYIQVLRLVLLIASLMNKN